MTARRSEATLRFKGAVNAVNATLGCFDDRTLNNLAATLEVYVKVLRNSADSGPTNAEHQLVQAPRRRRARLSLGDKRFLRGFGIAI